MKHGVPHSERRPEPAQLQSIHRFRRLPLEMPPAERRLLLFGGDVGSLLGGAVLALRWQALLEPHVRHGDYQVLWLVWLGINWLVAAAINECYTPQCSQQHFAALPHMLVASIEASVAYLVTFFLVGRPILWPGEQAGTYLAFLRLNPPPRLLPVLFLVVIMPLLAVWRMLYAQLVCSTGWRRRILIVGAGKAGCTLVEAMQRTLHDCAIIGFVDDDPEKQGSAPQGIPVLGTHHDLLQLVQIHQVSEVVLAITNDIAGGMSQALMHCCEQGICMHGMPLVYEEVLERIPIAHLGSKWFPVPLNHGLPTFYRVGKRLADIVLALAGMMLLVPLCISVAPAIYLETGGPIFYPQERLGRGGKRFWLLKFRTMIPHAEQLGQAVWATRGDARITRVGWLLRRTRLDELPQVLMVLKGEMSIVGPRPERPEFVQQLEAQIPFYRTRLSVKPGLTGWAQIKYHYGSTFEDAATKLEYDLYYIKHRSMLIDLLIVSRTLPVMLAGRGV